MDKSSVLDDPFTYFESPELKKPHVSKQKPTKAADQLFNDKDNVIEPFALKTHNQDTSLPFTNQSTVTAATVPTEGNNMWEEQDLNLSDDEEMEESKDIVPKMKISATTITNETT